MILLSTAGSIILSILIFIVAISIIVAIHELGHLTAAKMFGVYCFDYSIGFGPKLFRKRRKGRETYFTIRAVPLGGFVSMYGEGDANEDEKEIYIPPSRSLNGISHPKKFVVMGAGVFLNFILGFLILLFANAALPHAAIINSTASNEEQMQLETQFREDYGMFPIVINSKDSNNENVFEAALIKGFSVSNTSILVVDDNVKYNNERYFFCRASTTSSYSEEKFFNSDALILYKAKTENFSETDEEIMKSLHTDCVPDYSNESAVLKPDKDLTLTFTFKYLSSHTEEIDGKKKTIFDNINDYKIKNDCKLESQIIGANTTYSFVLSSDTGLSDKCLYMPQVWYQGGEVWANAGKQFGNGCALIFTTLGKLFTPSEFKNISGPVGIVKQTVNILQNYNAYTLFYFFGLISINLAIFNLLPFPGLDGWHLFVCLFEGIAKKDIPSKIKNIVSAIGLIILLGLSVVIIFKDIIGLF